MTPENFDQALEAFRDRSPFRPFTVVLHSDRQFEVDRAGALVRRDGVAIFVGPGGVPVVFAHDGVEHFAGDLPGRPSP
jgi:carbamate kinase